MNDEIGQENNFFNPDFLWRADIGGGWIGWRSGARYP
jgi:hypothetical protein